MQLQLEETATVREWTKLHAWDQYIIRLVKIKKEVYEQKVKSLRDKINKNAGDDEAKFKVTAALTACMTLI